MQYTENGNTEIISPKRDMILVFFGGAMSGIFGAGVASRVEELGLLSRVKSIYGTSVGSHNAAYLIAEQSELGSSIYWEECRSEHFLRIKKTRVLGKWMKEFIFGYTKKEILVDIDYLIHTEESVKILDIKKIQNSEIDFFVRCVDIDKKDTTYLDGKTQTLKKLHASSAMIPFYPKVSIIDTKKYCDGSTTGNIIDRDLEVLIKNNPDIQFILIFNNTQNKRNLIKQLGVKYIWAILGALYFRKMFPFQGVHALREYKKLKKYLKSPYIHIIEPNNSFTFFSTNKKILQRLYHHGQEKATELFKGI